MNGFLNVSICMSFKEQVGRLNPLLKDVGRLGTLWGLNPEPFSAGSQTH